jgi:hypothetical protein
MEDSLKALGAMSNNTTLAKATLVHLGVISLVYQMDVWGCFNPTLALGS